MTTVDELADEVAALRRRVESSEAVLAIHALKARYAELVDRRFSAGAIVDDDTLARVSQAVAELFTEGGAWDGGPGLGSVTGRPAIAERLRHPTLRFSRHFFVNPRIAVSGDTATGTWDLLSPCRRADGTSYWMCGYEEDAYARVDGIWLHVSMRLTTVFMAPIGEGWTKILV